MGKNSSIERFYEMFLDQLRSMYSSEEQVINSMPKMTQSAISYELKEAFTKHLEESKKQKERLKQAFDELGENAEGASCETMQSLIKECEKVIKKRSPSFVEDAALIGAVQKIEHYEMASYTSLKAFAHHLDLKNIEEVVDEILEEKKNAIKILTSIAESSWVTSSASS